MSSAASLNFGRSQNGVLGNGLNTTEILLSQESTLMMPAFDVPQSNIKKVIITADVVNKKTDATYVYDDTEDEQNSKKQSLGND